MPSICQYLVICKISHTLYEITFSQWFPNNARSTRGCIRNSYSFGKKRSQNIKVHKPGFFINAWVGVWGLKSYLAILRTTYERNDLQEASKSTHPNHYTGMGQPAEHQPKNWQCPLFRSQVWPATGFISNTLLPYWHSTNCGITSTRQYATPSATGASSQ